MKDYDEIASEYCDEFCSTQVYNGFIDNMHIKYFTLDERDR